MAAHKSMDTATIFSHLVNKARPYIGAGADAGGGSRQGADSEDAAPAPAKRPSAATKRKAALTRVIAKNNRKRRLNGGTA